MDPDANVDGRGNAPVAMGATTEPLPTPSQLADLIVADADALRTVAESRMAVREILSGADPRRLLVVVGPCSVHDVAAAGEYARRLMALAPEVDDALLLVMRAYVEKPRTTVGWKGLVSDPRLDGSCRLAEGLAATRSLLRDLTAAGQPTAVEFLSPLVAPYVADLVTWGAVGARTAESQIHRELVSALPVPVGFKNGTDGDVGVALDAIRASGRPHAFPWIDSEGHIATCRSPGNAHGHVILRGSPGKPNFGADHVRQAVEAAATRGIGDPPPGIVIDCSHDNCGKDHRRQRDALADVARQVRGGCAHIRGVMIESFLHEGRQDLPADSNAGIGVLDRLRPGVSITDACVGWDDTVTMLHDLAAAVRAGRPRLE